MMRSLLTLLFILIPVLFSLTLASGAGKRPPLDTDKEPPRAVVKDPWTALGIERIGPAEAPGFTLKDLDGKDHSLKDFKGSVVLLNFWTTWCTPCKEEMPYFEKLHKDFASKGLKVVAINDYEPRAKAVKYIKENPYTFLVLVNESGSVSENYRAVLLPTTFIIDGEGMAIGKASGLRNWSGPAAVKLIEELLTK